MHHPLEFIPHSKRKPIFWSLFALTLAMMAILQVVNIPLITPAAPQGIISFELAGSYGTVKWMLASWDASAQKYLAFSLGLDYLFMLLYSTTIALACLWAGEALARQWLAVEPPGSWPGLGPMGSGWPGCSGEHRPGSDLVWELIV